MKKMKKCCMLLMVAVICLCSISVVHAGTPRQEKIVGLFTKFAKSVMEVRQEEGDKPGTDYDTVMKKYVIDRKMNSEFKEVCKQIVNDAYYNHEKKMTPMDKKKEINMFTMLWYYKVCALVGMDPE